MPGVECRGDPLGLETDAQFMDSRKVGQVSLLVKGIFAAAEGKGNAGQDLPFPASAGVSLQEKTVPVFGTAFVFHAKGRGKPRSEGRGWIARSHAEAQVESAGKRFRPSGKTKSDPNLPILTCKRIPFGILLEEENSLAIP